MSRIYLPQVAWFHKPCWDLLWMVWSHPSRIFHYLGAKSTLFLTKRRTKVSQLQQLLVDSMEVQARVQVQYLERMVLKEKHQRKINKTRGNHSKYLNVQIFILLRATSQQRITRNYIVSTVYCSLLKTDVCMWKFNSQWKMQSNAAWTITAYLSLP